MKIQQHKFSKAKGWEVIRDGQFDPALSNFIIVFGSTELLSDKTVYDEIRSIYPNATILLNSTAGEIIDTQVNDDSISLTAILLEKTTIKTAIIQVQHEQDSFTAGKALAMQLDPNDLRNVLVIADGQKVNGSDLVDGLQSSLPKEVIITGGLAGDGARFAKTVIGLNEAPLEGRVAAIGFYGNNITINYGSVGGWDSFGHERLITKAKQNVLYELDNKPALDIYKKYLGDYAKDLPLSGLLFPLSIRNEDYNSSLVRTILAVNEEDKSLTFAGNMPEGSYARLMTANFDRLIEGASNAAQKTMDGNKKKPDLALLISCVGRKIVLNQRIEEEVEVVRNIYGNETAITGFYSYGEICPSLDEKCDLHNQTMTITTLTEE
ncbi:FIST signal transduction protein [Ferruginibacter albus]|uniref:FIST signal transduction protein n=1 Tax=Ferruginibacter albus TaxID=2875540 RepID=UPI001CC3733D|nr:FIST N-terminal domain-containing protein [Ferruginibacter albus]UAY53343.1 FIST C-terminal domain-containing protein [Ferruginibacter albus]